MTKRQKLSSRLSSIFEMAPELKAMLSAEETLDLKRSRIRNWLSQLLANTYESNPEIPPLEYILKRDAINVFQNLLAQRNENLAGFSVLEYLVGLVSDGKTPMIPQPAPAFLAEIEHLIKGIFGQTGIYKEKPPVFFKHSGRKAARMRSDDLSRMAKKVDQTLQQYACGLDNGSVRRRSINKTRILKYFNATELEWNDWKWHLRHVVRDVEQLKALVELTQEEYEAVFLARKNHIPFGVTPYYLSLMDHEAGGRQDKAIRAQVIPSLNYVNKIGELKNCTEKDMDFMLERDTSPIEGITRRYPNIVILKPILTCPQICVYCQRNWEIEDMDSSQAALSKAKLDEAIDWIAATPEINEVLVTGGDPFMLPDTKLEYITSRLATLPHLIRIRFGTRTPVTMPQRINESLTRKLSRFHIPGKRELIIVTHFEHPYEITPESMQAVQRFRRCGVEVYNQVVYTFYNSRRFEAAMLRQKLRLIGVTPYYTFNTKGKEETNDFRVPIARLMQEQKEEARLLPGTVRTDEIVFNVPGLGKNYLKASQHHDVISILPDGRRVYEFHPWEKKLSLVNTYVYQDVAIHDYLQRLQAEGEDPALYRSIWYYY